MEIIPRVVATLLCWWEEVSSGSYSTAILNPLPGVVLLYCVVLLSFIWLHLPYDGPDDSGKLWISSSPRSKPIRNSLL